MRPVQYTFAGDAGEKPGEFGYFWHIGLAVEHDTLRIEPAGKPTGGDFERGALDACRVVNFDEGMVMAKK